MDQVGRSGEQESPLALETVNESGEEGSPLALETGAFFAEREDDEVSGFAIIDSNEESGRYRVAEKWEREDGDSSWISYWIEAHVLAERERRGSVEYLKQVSAEQLEGFRRLIRVSRADGL